MVKAHRFTYRRRVEFSETDMAGIVHFSNFFRWMEAAEADFFRSLNVPLIVAEGETVTGWPRVRASCAYHAPIRFGEEVEVILAVKELKIRAIAYAFKFYKIGEANPVASGEMTTVFASRPSAGGAMAAASIPESLLDQIEAAPDGVFRKD